MDFTPSQQVFLTQFCRFANIAMPYYSWARQIKAVRPEVEIQSLMLQAGWFERIDLRVEIAPCLDTWNRLPREEKLGIAALFGKEIDV
ncbi:MAG: hypothetical protein KY445_13815 [Armatimonadetes bacterium]|nr:hypothetical protein [Armatimonadota bacterium]